MANLEPPQKSESSVPGYGRELRTRIISVIDRIGTLKKAAKLAGATDEQVARWRDGKSRLPLHAAAEMCRAAGVSLDWLVHGKGEATDQAGFDGELMEAVIAGAYDFMEARGLRARSGEDFHRLCMALYDLAKEEGAESVDLAKYSNVVDLATFSRGAG